MRRLCKKLSSRRGMSLSELLMAVMILSLVALGAAVGVSAAMNAYQSATQRSDAQQLSATLSAAMMDELRYARDIQADGSFTSDSWGEGVAFSTADGKVTLGGASFLGDGAYAGLSAQATVTLAGGLFHVTLEIADSQGGPLTTAEFSVAPLNSP